MDEPTAALGVKESGQEAVAIMTGALRVDHDHADRVVVADRAAAQAIGVGSGSPDS